MGLNGNNVLSIKFHIKSLAVKGCQMIFRWSSTQQRTTKRLPNDLQVVLYIAEDHLKIIWQPLTAQNLFWNLILKALLQLSSKSLTSLLQGGPQFKPHFLKPTALTTAPGLPKWPLCCKFESFKDYRALTHGLLPPQFIVAKGHHIVKGPEMQFAYKG